MITPQDIIEFVADYDEVTKIDSFTQNRAILRALRIILKVPEAESILDIAIRRMRRLENLEEWEKGNPIQLSLHVEYPKDEEGDEWKKDK